MSDLSRLLDDVYEPAAKDDEGADENEAEAWTSEHALDDAFHGWVPGPAEDASGTERKLFAEAKAAAPSEAAGPPAPPTGSIPSAPPADRVESAPDLAGDATEDRWATVPGTADEAVEGAPAPVAWQPQDDDILPKRASRRLLGLRR